MNCIECNTILIENLCPDCDWPLEADTCLPNSKIGIPGKGCDEVKTVDLTKCNHLSNATIRINGVTYPQCDDCYGSHQKLTRTQLLNQVVTPQIQKKNASQELLYRDRETGEETTSSKDSKNRNNPPVMILDTTKQTTLINKYLNK